MEQSQKVDHNDLFIVITTSPVPSNPATDVIDAAITSIKQQPSLAGISITIVCDGCKVTEENASKYKSGIVSKEALENYESFKINLKKKYQSDPTVTIIQRNARHCFAENIRFVMQNRAQPFVMVFQHDHKFLRQMDMFPIVQAMKRHPINYIGFMNKSVSKLPFTLDQNANLRKYFSSLVGYSPQGSKHNHEDFTNQVLAYYDKLYQMPLMPLIFWYDKVHIARKSFYLEVIFNEKGFYDEIKKTYLKTVSFVEDSFGTSTMKNIRNRPEKFEQVQSFILWDNPEPAIIHIHGRNFLTKDQKEDIYLKHLKEKQDSSSQSFPGEEPEQMDLSLFQQQQN